MSTRVHELAKELGLQSAELLARIQASGLEVKASIFADLDAATVDRIRAIFDQQGMVVPARVNPAPPALAPTPRPLTAPALAPTRPSLTPRLTVPAPDIAPRGTAAFAASAKPAVEHVELDPWCREMGESSAAWIFSLAHDLEIEQQAFVDFVHDWKFDAQVGSDLAEGKDLDRLGKSISLAAAVSGLLPQDSSEHDIVECGMRQNAMGDAVSQKDLRAWAMVPTQLLDLYESLNFPVYETKLLKRRFVQLALDRMFIRLAELARKLQIPAERLRQFLGAKELYWALSPLGPLTPEEESLIHRVAFTYRHTSVQPPFDGDPATVGHGIAILPESIMQMIRLDWAGHRFACEVAGELGIAWPQFANLLQGWGVASVPHPLTMMKESELEMIRLAHRVADDLGFLVPEVRAVFDSTMFTAQFADRSPNGLPVLSRPIETCLAALASAFDAAMLIPRDAPRGGPRGVIPLPEEIARWVHTRIGTSRFAYELASELDLHPTMLYKHIRACRRDLIPTPYSPLSADVVKRIKDLVNPAEGCGPAAPTFSPAGDLSKAVDRAPLAEARGGHVSGEDSQESLESRSRSSADGGSTIESNELGSAEALPVILAKPTKDQVRDLATLLEVLLQHLNPEMAGSSLRRLLYNRDSPGVRLLRKVRRSEIDYALIIRDDLTHAKPGRDRRPPSQDEIVRASEYLRWAVEDLLPRLPDRVASAARGTAAGRGNSTDS